MVDCGDSNAPAKGANDDSTWHVLSQGVWAPCQFSGADRILNPAPAPAETAPAPVERPNTNAMTPYVRAGMPAEPLSGAPTLEKIANFMSDHFDRLAVGGEIGARQMRDAAENGNWSPQDRPFVEALNSVLLEEFRKVSQPMYRNISGSGLNKEEVDKVKDVLRDYREWRQKEKEAVPLTYQMANYATKNFNRLDTDHNGILTKDEIDLALKNSANAEERLLLSAIKDNFNTIMHPRGQTSTQRMLAPLMESGSGISPFDFQKYLDQQYLNSLSLPDRVGPAKDWAFTYDMLGWYENKYRSNFFAS